MIDSTAIRATRASLGAGKKGGMKNRTTIPRTKPGRPEDEDSRAVRCQWCTAEPSTVPQQASGSAYAQPLLDNAYIPSLRWHPRKRCRWLQTEKRYDAEARYPKQPVIPLRTMKRKPKPGLSRLFDHPKYRQWNIIEPMCGWLKEICRIVTRFDKFAKSCEAMLSLACAVRCLRQYYSYSAQYIYAKSQTLTVYSKNQPLKPNRLPT